MANDGFPLIKREVMVVHVIAVTSVLYGDVTRKHMIYLVLDTTLV